MPEDSRQGSAAAQQALTALRQAIHNGDMVPGQRLVETELAETFAVTRASVRAALIELTSEGLVERIPNRGARVRIVPLEEAVANTECRMVLEGLCSANAAKRVTDEQIDQLRAIGDQMVLAVDGGEPLKYSDLNHQLHSLVRDISGQHAATDLIARLRGPIIRHQFRLSLIHGRPQVSLREHLAIIRAIADRDPTAAEHAARRHVASVIDALRSSADDTPQSALAKLSRLPKEER